MPRFFLKSRRFWLLVVPFFVNNILMPVLAKLGVEIPSETVQQIIEGILTLLTGAGVIVALQPGPKVSFTNPSHSA